MSHLISITVALPYITLASFSFPQQPFCNAFQDLCFISTPKVNAFQWFCAIVLVPSLPSTRLQHFHSKSEHLPMVWRHGGGSGTSLPHFCLVKSTLRLPDRRRPLWSETFISDTSFPLLLHYLPTLWLHFPSHGNLFAIPSKTFASFPLQK